MRTDPSAEPALVALNADANRLAEHIRLSTAPAAVLTQCADLVQQAITLLADQQHRGPRSASCLKPSGHYPTAERGQPPLMPYSPFTGHLNPISPQVTLHAVAGEIHASAHFSSLFAGPIETVHGGTIAAVFDELLSMALLVNDIAAFTGSLNVRYLKPTPIETEVSVITRRIGVDGRKARAYGEMRANGELTATAEGLFIIPEAAPSRSP